MASIQDIPVEILAIIFEFQPNWFLPILCLVNTKFRHAVKLCSSEYEPPTYGKIAGNGWLSVLKWLRKQDPPYPWNEWTCMAAAKEGHLEVLKWLRKQDPPCPWNKMTCWWAAEKGHLEILKWLREQDPPCPWNSGTCRGKAARWAAEKGHLEILKWLRDQDRRFRSEFQGIRIYVG